MSILSQRTDLKSLRYGKDRVGGGSSNQPYIKSSIPTNSSSLDRSGGVDFLLRGGTLTPSRAIEDVSRLTKMFFDFKSPNGILFTAKQNLLSRTGVKTQASGILNEGIYLPTSTLLQAGGNAFGIHLNKQGINPFRNTSPDEGIGSLFGFRDPLGLPVYSQTVKNNQSKKDNRLVQLANRKLGVSPSDNSSLIPSPLSFIGVLANVVSNILPISSSISTSNLEILKYGGGPGSVLGIGKTTIKRSSFTDEGKTKAKRESAKNKSFYGKTPLSNVLNETKNRGLTLIKQENKIPFKVGMGIPSITSQQGLAALITNPFYPLFPYLKTNTNDGLNFDKVGNDIFKGKYYVLDSTTIFNKTSSKDNTNISDFRTEIPSSQISPGEKKNILSKSPKYNIPGNRIENRVNLGDPGRRNKNVLSYTNGLGVLDRITAMPLYQSDKGNHSGDRNDLVKFSIGIIDNDDPKKRTYIHFRAFLDSMDDNYNAEWNAFKYMGRGENFFRYNGFTRAINLGWTVAAQSKEELIPMYQKLNFLASSLAPDYSANGYMRGNLAVLTVGGYLFEQPGIINNINYSVPTESPWEIGINNSDDIKYDTKVKELPHIIRVTGFNFTPIHTFVPKLQKNTYEGTYTNTRGGVIEDEVVSKFGNERYIALSTGTNIGENTRTNNYDSPLENYTWGPTAQARRKETEALASLPSLERTLPQVNISLPSPNLPNSLI